MTDSTTPNPAPESAAVPEATQAPAAAEAPAQEVVETPAPQPEPVAAQAAPVQAPVVEAEPPAPVAIPVAEPAPLAVPAAAPPAPEPAKAAAAGASAAASADVLDVPLKLLNQLLAKLGTTQLNSLADLVPVLRIVALAVVAGIALKLTSATIGAIDDLPLVGGLLELVGLVSLLNFLARNAFKQQKRAELLARIQKLKTDLLG